MNCTEDEIAMLARFYSTMEGQTMGAMSPWIEDVRSALGGAIGYDEGIIRAAARLMRESRRLGAEEMRERAALVSENSDVSLTMRATIAREIRALASSKDEGT